MTLHNLLANSELHEPKGVATAADNDVYIANGSGSGSWAPLVENIDADDFVENLAVTGLGDYAILGMSITNWLHDIADAQIGIQVGNSGGYYTTANGYKYVAWEPTSNSRSFIEDLSNETIPIGMGTETFSPTNPQNWHMVIYNFNKPLYKVVKFTSGIHYNSFFTTSGLCIIKSAAAMDRIRVFEEEVASYDAQGRYQLWGVKG